MKDLKRVLNVINCCLFVHYSYSRSIDKNTGMEILHKKYRRKTDVKYVTGDMKIPQVLLNRVPEQVKEDNVWYQNVLLKINFRVEITIFTQCDKV